MELEEIKSIINKLPNTSYYVNVSLTSIERTLNEYSTSANYTGGKLILIPDFQRGNVWTEKQQIHYMENLYRGIASSEIKFATGTWMGGEAHDEYMKNLYVLDGLQRLTAMRRFVNGEFKLFDGRLSNEDILHIFRLDTLVTFSVYCIPTREECINLYLDINSGGTPHEEKELERVRNLL